MHFVLERFSKLDKALRILAYVWRFLKRCDKGSIPPNSRHTSEEQKYLADKIPLPMSSPLLNLFRFMDQLGLLRECGCLTASRGQQYDELHLLYDCRLSRLLIQFSQQVTLHSGSTHISNRNRKIFTNSITAACVQFSRIATASSVGLYVCPTKETLFQIG